MAAINIMKFPLYFPFYFPPERETTPER